MTTYDPKLLDKYAELAIKVGVNIQENQRLIIGSFSLPTTGVALELYPLVRALTKHAYLAGAKFVNVLWEDPQLTLIRLDYGKPNSLDEYPDWRVQTAIEYMEAGDATLSIYAQDPDLLAGQDSAALEKLLRAAVEKTAPAAALSRSNVVNWSIIGGAIEPWAKKVFPDLAPKEAEGRLWEVIFDICRIEADDPVAVWRQHMSQLTAMADYLNAKQYRALHYKAPGTDLTVGLPFRHVWITANLTARNGIEAVVNIPSEEVFTMAHRDEVNGTVRATKPLSHNGQLIDGFAFTFKNGRVVEATAEIGQEALDSMLEIDSGARYLGEVALVPNSSPISKSGLLFYNTLFDENASSHLALGNAYKFSIQDGSDMDDETFAASGGNKSKVHVDFMIGSNQMNVDGLTEDGRAEPVMRAGEWAFDV
jgi:aminopeptidase